MRRREFIGLLGGAATWPVVARAQQSERVRRIAVIFGGFGVNDPELHARVTALKSGMQDLGWVEGRNTIYTLDIAVGDLERLQTQVTELVKKSPDVIVCNGTAAMRAVLQVTQTIPVVAVNTTDLIAAGVTSSLARPGGNVTGFPSFEPSIIGKWLELMGEVAPTISRVAIIFDPPNRAFWQAAEAILNGKQASALRAVPIEVSTRLAMSREMELFAKNPQAGLIFPPSSISTASRTTIIEFAKQHRLPTVFGFPYLAREGALLSYGIDVPDSFRRSALYIDRIFRGTNPSDLPIQQPTKFILAINLGTARALGLTIPPTLLARADEVIE